jgi:hypothetical protein
VEPGNSVAIDEILRSSRKHNSDNQITGVLYFSNNYFLQYLEGSKNNVLSTYQRISIDSRHTDVRLITTAEIENREFDQWAMAYIPQSDILKPMHLKFTNSPDFNAPAISKENAYEVISALHEQLPKAHYDSLTP